MSWRERGLAGALCVALATLTLIGVSATAPSGRTERSWITRSSLLCMANGKSPISSKNSVPPSAAWKNPTRSSLAPVKAPLR